VTTTTAAPTSTTSTTDVTTTTAAPTTMAGDQSEPVQTLDPQTLPATGRSSGAVELYLFVLLISVGALLARVARR
jgi:hypothetical protein